MPKLLRYAALVIALLAAVMWMKHEKDAEACRKAGGSWDSAANACVPAARATPG
ncbi:MAG: hypothetical protein JWP72_1380 [Massilia sp.]|jgi:hypothetical protein|nr:hypothetical protein [Massilia sp.]MDB5790225.1 hypothetical protein [Massilia sp.]